MWISYPLTQLCRFQDQRSAMRWVRGPPDRDPARSKRQWTTHHSPSRARRAAFGLEPMRYVANRAAGVPRESDAGASHSDV